MDRQTIEQLLSATGKHNKLHPASTSSIEKLTNLGYPEQFIYFYYYYEPVGMFRFGNIVLYDTDGILADVGGTTPGSYVYRHGLLPFARDERGDEFFFMPRGKTDKQHRVVWFPSSEDVSDIGTKKELLSRVEYRAEDFDAFIRTVAEAEICRARENSRFRRFFGTHPDIRS